VELPLRPNPLNHVMDREEIVDAGEGEGNPKEGGLSLLDSQGLLQVGDDLGVRVDGLVLPAHAPALAGSGRQVQVWCHRAEGRRST
jgi:hypothetical protein